MRSIVWNTWPSSIVKSRQTCARFTRLRTRLRAIGCVGSGTRSEWKCGRQIYATAPVESLFAEERRCPRCGAYLNADRRDIERRTYDRRERPKATAGPPEGHDEVRIEERRKERRRAAAC